jgi:hypothetical protein
MSGRFIATACLIVLLSPWPSIAQSDSGQKDKRGIFNDRFRISISGYRSDFETVASVNSSTAGLGTSIRFENTFNVPNWDEYINLWGYSGCHAPSLLWQRKSIQSLGSDCP